MGYQSRRASVVAVGLSVACAGACDANDVGVVDDVTPRSEADNGIALNSAAVNGWQLNGWQLNGWQLNGWQLNGWQLNGWQLNGVTLNGSVFKGTKLVGSQSVPIQGVDFIGAQITLSDANQQQVTLRIDNVYKNPAKPTGDVYFHDISALNPTTGTWSSVCRDSNGQPAAAIVLANAWNMTTGARVDAADAITIACRGAALAKCVEWNYRPWATATSCTSGTCKSISLKDHHQACTRMVRADYCGDGTPHTFNGTPIDLFDKLSPVIQAEGTKNYSNWALEAEWGPNGALCTGDALRLQMFDDRDIPYTVPSCLDSIDNISGCGNFTASRGALVVNKYCPVWTTNPGACAGGDDWQGEQQGQH